MISTARVSTEGIKAVLDRSVCVERRVSRTLTVNLLRPLRFAPNTGENNVDSFENAQNNSTGNRCPKSSSRATFGE